MDGRKPDVEELTPDEQDSKVGDLGRGSHEQTQGGGKAGTTPPLEKTPPPPD
jgi:hypothetical protein